ncbi:MAG: chaperone modulator CbpM [Flavitalea sp.]
MDTELFAITDYCSVHQIDAAFIESLEKEGLILVVNKDENKYVEEEQLHMLEIFTRWHMEMGINTQGIDAMHHLVARLKAVHYELDRLKTRLRFYEE